MIELRKKSFSNGSVYCLKLDDGMLIETTDTFLPYYTKDAVGRKQNMLDSYDLGSRNERWMIGVSVMSGCPVRCKFCATGQMKKWRNLSAKEIVDQVLYIISLNDTDPSKSMEFKINYTRIGEPFLNIDNVKEAISTISRLYPNTHHYISTIGVKNADYSWITGNTTLQLSLHSLNDAKRNEFIPYRNKVSISELGKIRTKSSQKTTLNLSLVDEADFDIDVLKDNFSKEDFFIKLSPINPNVVSDSNNYGTGIIEGVNLM